MKGAKDLRFLVIGCGSIGRRHIRNLIFLGAEKIVACEPDPSRRTQVQNQFGIAVFPSVGEALESKPNAVLVCTPPVFHADIARAAAAVGCHLFIEKPISHTLEGLDELIHEVEVRNLVTLVGYNWRFHPSFRQMKQLIDHEAVGGILCARVNCGQYLPDWHPAEDYRQSYSAKRALGGGVLLDSHELDYLTWFLGNVERILCVAQKVSDLSIETEDIADLILVFQSGAQATVHLDYLQRPAHRSYELFGTQGTIHWSLGNGLFVYRANSGEREVFPEPPGLDLNSTYLEELQHFIDCIRGEARAFLDARRGKEILKLILAAKYAASESAWLPPSMVSATR